VDITGSVIRERDVREYVGSHASHVTILVNDFNR
jgi:hypothetical protein